MANKHTTSRQNQMGNLRILERTCEAKTACIPIRSEQCIDNISQISEVPTKSSSY